MSTPLHHVQPALNRNALGIQPRFSRFARMLTVSGIFLLGSLFAAGGLASTANDLADHFSVPPREARPWVYWYWINGTMTREGVTADLEAMHRVGIGGVMIMEVDHGTPGGPLKFASPEWCELFRFTLAEADRLGMQVNMANDAGWCGSGGPWITPELSMQKVVWTGTEAEGPRQMDEELPQPKANGKFYRDIAVLAMPMPADDSYRIPNVDWKAGFATKSPLSAFPKTPIELPILPTSQTIPRDRIIDLTAKFQNGRLKWDLPEGKWIIYRFGYTSTGVTNHPAPGAGQGLECDRLSTAAMDVHFANLLQKLIDIAGPLAGKTLVSTHIDSWESGGQNWTARMRDEFQQRRGYDLLPYLPVISGRVVESLEVSERFLWDLRSTLAELVQENYAGHLRTLANQRGLRLSIEAYDWEFCDDLSYAGQADEPQAEFWNGPDPGGYRYYAWCANMASAAHVYGKRIVGAEAFTSMPQVDRWRSHPGTLKLLGDWALCEGINRFLFHTFTMQSRQDLYPGLGMGGWGLHYERTQTWWEQSKPWHDYLARCQYLLRNGLFVADLCYLQPEGAPMRFQPPVESNSAEMPDRPGYNYDGCTPEVVLARMRVKDGLLLLPDQMSYRALVLPETTSRMPGAGLMTPKLLAKIAELVEAGATVIGKRPVRSPSLVGYPGCDEEVKRLADKLWGDGDMTKPGERTIGKGRVHWGRSPANVLAEAGVPPDFACRPQVPPPVRYIHRRTNDGTEIYFVANKRNQPVETVCSFRVTGKRPEWWWPETGRITKVTSFKQENGITTIPLRLEAGCSVFVIFGAPCTNNGPIISVTRNGVEILNQIGTSGTGRPVNGTCDSDPDSQVPALDITQGEIWRNGDYTFLSEDGTRSVLQVSLPQPQEINGPWDVSFDPKWGGPERMIFDSLDDWSKRSEPDIRYYSGSATYRNRFHWKPGTPGEVTYLDLGTVAVAADVILNGRSMGTLWKAPFRIDVTEALKAGENQLELKIVNLWVNRLIGDEQLEEDCEWRKSDWSGGQPLAQWPKWLTDHEPRSSGRRTFTTWKLWNKSDALVESGLIGPVRLETARRTVVPSR